MKRKLLSLLVCISMVASLSTGCASSQSNTASGGSAANGSGDKSITIMVEKGSPAEATAKATAADFKKQTGYDVKIDAVAYTGMQDKLLAETRSGQTVHDAAVLDVLWLPSLKNSLQPLDKVVTSKMTSDFLPTLLANGKLDGTLYGVPSWINCKVLIYRKDLFNNSANKAAYKAKFGEDLRVPTDWDSYYKCAQFFTNSKMHGTSVFGANSSDSVDSWLDAALQAGAGGVGKYYVFDKNNNVLVNQAPYVKALDWLCKVYKNHYAPSETLTIASAESESMFQNGKLAMQLNWAHQYAAAYAAMGAAKVGVAPMIAGSAGIGAVGGPWYECVFKNSKKINIADQYVQYMYNHNNVYLKQPLKLIASKSVYTKNKSVAGLEHLTSILTTLSAKQSNSNPLTSEHTTEIYNVLAAAIQSALQGTATPQKALDNAKAQIEGIIQ